MKPSSHDSAPASDTAISLRVCPTCGHDLGSAAGGATSSICPQCGGLCAVLAEVDQEQADQGVTRGNEPALGSHAARGFTFMLIQGVGTRIVGFACQMALSYLLLREHFGLLALADSMAAFANVLQLIGVREILISRHKRFHLWENAGFWIMTSTSWLTTALLTGVALFVWRARGNADLAGMIMLIGLSIPLISMSSIAEAKLQVQLRFKFLAGVIGLWAVLMPLGQVACALMGFGVYSLIIPRVVASIVRLVLVHRAAKLNIQWNPHLRRWRFIIGTSLIYFFTSILLTVAQVGDRPILGLFVDEDTLGLYAFAFAFSLQTIMIISINLQQVLFATLTKLNDEPKRQLSAFLRASRVLATIITPVCLLQAAASESVVRTLFEYEKWKDAVPAMQVLGFAMVFHGSFCPATAMLEARRRFTTKFKIAVGYAIAYVIAVLVGTTIGYRINGPLGAVLGTAAGVAAVLTIGSPVWGYVAIRSLGGTVADTLGIVARPLIAGGAATGIGLLIAGPAGRAAAGHIVLHRDSEHWVHLFTLCAVTCVAYLPLMRLLMPNECRELGAKIGGIAARIWPPGGRIIRHLCNVKGVSSTAA